MGIHLGVSENMVPLHPMDYDHVPIKMAITGVSHIFRQTHLHIPGLVI